MTPKRGVDLARWQNPFALPYPAWLADGLEVVVIQITHGAAPEPVADEHLAVAVAAGVPHIGAYHWLTPQSGQLQALTFKTELQPQHQYQFVAIDVEQDGVTAQHLLDFLAELGPGFKLTILLYGNNLLAAIVAAHPELKMYGVWYPGYPTFPLPCSDPPYLLPRNVPASIAGQVKAWQYAGNNGIWLPFKGAIDRSIWYEIPGAPMPTPTTNRGCLLWGHTQGNSSIIPIYRQIQDKARAQGKTVRLKFLIADEDGGKMLEATDLGVESKVNRKHLPEGSAAGDRHWMEGGGSAETPLTPQQKQDWINTAKMLPYKASPTEFKDTTWFQVMGNEWERTSAQGWLDYLDMCLAVIEQGKQLSTHDKAMLMGISDAEAATLPPVRYAFPVFNAGSPHIWDFYKAIADHPIWKVCQDEGHLSFCHEGIRFDDPFDYLADGGPNDQGVRGHNTMDGAPYIPGSGLMNFRIFYLLYLLWQKGIRVKWGVGEWYDGRRPRDHQVPERVANMIRHDNLLSGIPFAADCVGYGQFQFDNNPTSPWYQQDCTLLWQTPEWQQHVIDVSERINGETAMKYYTDAQVAAMQADLAQAQVILASGHQWKAGDIALAIISPLVTYNSPNGTAKDLRPPFPPGGPVITYDLNVAEVSPDGAWLRVAPALWVRAVDVKLKA